MKKEIGTVGIYKYDLKKIKQIAKRDKVSFTQSLSNIIKLGVENLDSCNDCIHECDNCPFYQEGVFKNGCQ
jgi:hypothetical protein